MVLYLGSGVSSCSWFWSRFLFLVLATLMCIKKNHNGIRTLDDTTVDIFMFYPGTFSADQTTICLSCFDQYWLQLCPTNLKCIFSRIINFSKLLGSIPGSRKCIFFQLIMILVLHFQGPWVSFKTET